MLSELFDVFKESVSICLLVILMMCLIELFNVATQGRVFKGMEKHPFLQVIVASLLGVIPGCTGGFVGVSLYSHRMIGFSALLAMLIATTGDESLLMLSLCPKEAVLLFVKLFVLAVIVGCVTEIITRRSGGKSLPIGSDRHDDDNYEIHGCGCGDSHCEPEGSCDHQHISLKDKILHFLREHVWNHVIKRHLLSIFAWTFGVMAVFAIISHFVDIETWIRGNTAVMIVLAVLIGLIPQSGPHMIFVTMFASGVIPLPVLLASSISQDGHSCLPLLAENKKSFAQAKLIKSIIALLVAFCSMLWM